MQPSTERTTEAALEYLLWAADNIIWKTGFNMLTRAGETVPGTINRNDATVIALRRALARYRETVDPSLSLCGEMMCDWCDARWCEDGQD